MKFLAFFIFLIVSQGYTQSFNRQKMDSLLDYMSQKNQVMGNVAIYQNNKKAYTQSFGYLDIMLREKANSETLYRIGSISKTYTATIIMQLVEEGKLQLDTKLNHFFPDLPHASKITIRQLLNHHSGLPNLADSPDYSTYRQSPQTETELLNRIKKYDSDFEPGEKSEYSNTNYIVLSFIAQEIEKRPFKKIIDQRIFSPLKLKRSRFGGKIKTKNNEAWSYTYNSNGWEIYPETDMSIPMGAGAVVSTAKELAKFYVALFTGKLLDPSSVKEMEKTEDGYGLGLVKMHFRDKVNFGYTGAIDGFKSFAAYFPEEKTSFTLCTNASRMEINNLILGILNIYYGYDYQFPPFNPVKNIGSFIGTYRSQDFPLDLKIFSKDKQLFGQATGQSAFPLSQIADNTFEYAPADLKIEFFPASKSIKFTQRGLTHELKQEK